jgi:hypothetical protein
MRTTLVNFFTEYEILVKSGRTGANPRGSILISFNFYSLEKCTQVNKSEKVLLNSKIDFLSNIHSMSNLLSLSSYIYR